MLFKSMPNNYESWGRFPLSGVQEVQSCAWTDEARDMILSMAAGRRRFLPRGLGRSYGDSCLVATGSQLWLTTAWDRVIGFDREGGVFTAEAGISFEQILKVVLPAGWFLPVTPGTKYITLAGAIANDIHGKNHHAAGNFGNHVIGFDLLRSDGRVIHCTENDAPASESGQLFRATIGGLGLTGVILNATFRLKKVAGPYIDQEIIKFRGIEDFIRITSESEVGFEYTVSWVDCLSSGKDLRGLFIRGNHSSQTVAAGEKARAKPKLRIPFDFPSMTLNPLSVRAFNTLYYHKQFSEKKSGLTHYDPFFYPLDSVLEWNRIYGKRGFLQYQFVVPYEADAGRAVNEIMDRIARSGQGSFLAVLKVFGNIPGRGLLSFPRPGVTLALDFKNTGSGLLKLLDELDALVMAAGGAIYPAKDARMSSNTFFGSFQEAKEFTQFIDPCFHSKFSTRIGLTS